MPEEELKMLEKDLYPTVEKFLNPQKIAPQNTLKLNYLITEERKNQPQSRRGSELEYQKKSFYIQKKNGLIGKTKWRQN